LGSGAGLGEGVGLPSCVEGGEAAGEAAEAVPEQGPSFDGDGRKGVWLADFGVEAVADPGGVEGTGDSVEMGADGGAERGDEAGEKLGDGGHVW